MKASASFALLLLARWAAAGPVDGVVTKLKQMLSDSKAAAAEEAEQFATFKSYCLEWRTKSEISISKMDTKMQQLTNLIDSLNGKKDKLEEEIEDLEKDLAKNKESQDLATATRNKEAAAYAEFETDYLARAQQLTAATEKLRTVQPEEADSTDAASTALMSLNLGEMSSAASDDLRRLQEMQMQEMQRQSKSFLQIQRRYDPQSGGVMGVLQSVRDSTIRDLREGKARETKSIDEHTKLMAGLNKDQDTLEASKSSKTAEVATTAQDISTSEGELATVTETKADDEAFLADLNANCAEKTRINSERLELRRKENEAIQKAVVTLDSYRAAVAFDKNTATSFLQVQSISADPDVIALVQFLRKEASSTNSSRLAQVAGLARVASLTKKDFNPFAIVLDKIETMKGQIKDESNMDIKQRDWCEKERRTNYATKADKESEMINLQVKISNLKTDIDDPSSGLLITIDSEETDLKNNNLQQKEVTDQRRADNREYQKQIQNLVATEDMLQTALDSLKVYYKEMRSNELNALVQKKKKVMKKAHRADSVPAGTAKAAPDAPQTAGKAYSGQSTTGDEVIALLEGILKNTQDETALTHKTEAEAQDAFEDTMKLLTQTAADLVKEISENKQMLATTLVDKTKATDQHKAVDQEKKAIEEYLRTIKPSCDFMIGNFVNREASRRKETEALEKAKTLIKESPLYQNLSDVAKRKR